MKRTAVLAVLAIALAASATAAPIDAATQKSPADTVIAGTTPSADAAAAQRKSPPQPTAQPASADREFYALMAASLLAIGALFWRRRGNSEEA
jgi:hypothetical protein